MVAYLDNAATTRCAECASKAVENALRVCYGNPSSMHKIGMEAEELIKDARRTIAGSLKANEKEIIFTSGGTESNNLAVFGAARAKKRQGNHIISTMIEHPSVYNPIMALKDEGFDIGLLPVDKSGLISLEQLYDMVNDKTILVSIQHVNNEIGTIEPIEEAAKIIRKKAPKALFHVDAVQSYGKLPLNPTDMDIDLLSVSGHKICAPKGSGFLYIRKGVHILPLIYGGGQEETLRSGTENVPAISGFNAAVKEAFKEDRAKGLYALRESFISRLSGAEGVSINGSKEKGGSAPHIVSVSVEGVRSEVLLHALEEKGVYVSAGSACSSNRRKPSRTLVAMGLSREALDSTIRFSFSYETTAEETEYAAEALLECIPVLRRFTRR